MKRTLSQILKTDNTPFVNREIERIISLPIETQISLDEEEVIARQYVDVRARRNGFSLTREQAFALRSYINYDGAFCPIKVGQGKTLITEIIATIAYEKNLNKILLLIPPGTYEQLTRRDIPWARSRVSLTVPFHGLGGKAKAKRLAIAGSGRRGCYIMPYSLLSVSDTRDLLNNIAPELIICDEAHNLKSRKTARTKRLFDYIDKHHPEGVCLSGTITDKSVRDFHHLIRWCLGSLSPLPSSTLTVGEWAQALDAGADVTGARTGPLEPLKKWARDNFPTEEIPAGLPGFRMAFKLRLNSCPGVVSLNEEGIGTSLYYENRPSKYPISPDTEELMRKVEDDYITPNGDPIDHAIHTWRHLYSLTSGIWHRLTWPEEKEFAAKKNLSHSEAKRLIDAAKFHHEAYCDFAKCLRNFLSNTSRPGADTPMLVESNMVQHGPKNVTQELYDLWEIKKRREVLGMPERDSTPVRVDDYKMRQLIDWCQENKNKKGKIVWVHHRDVGVWACELLREAGIPVVHCPSGEAYNVLIQDPKSVESVVVASIKAHGTGKNLQQYQFPYFLEWPRSATWAEQTVGRVHRKGQTADEIFVRQNLTTPFDTLNLAACLNDSLYISQSTGQPLKVIYGSYNPMPVIVPSDFLRERGAQNKRLTREQQELLNTTFSND